MRTPTPFRLFLTTGLSVLVAACSLAPSAAAVRSDAAAAQTLRPGDSWAGMTLTTGGDTATPVWEVCQPAIDEADVHECRVPAVPLAIGPSAAALLDPINLAEWNQFEWTLLVDGKPVALDSFGVFDFSLPRKAANGREALAIFHAWDVVLADPKPGPHVLQGTVTRLSHPGKEVGMLREVREWVIYLVVE